MKELFSISNTIRRNGLFCLIITLICCYHYLYDSHYLPHGIHTWAQGDRYAICINYYDYGLQLFYPRINNIATGPEHIASCELHITGYLAACIAKPFGLRAQMPFLVRFINLLFVVGGLWFLFDIIYRHTQHFILALIPVFFAFTSPLLIHYTFNFLPDTSGIAFCWAAFVLLFRFFTEKKIKLLYWGLAAISFATLNKISFIFYFGIFGLLSLYILWEQRQTIKSAIIYLSVAFIAFCSLIALFFWIKYLQIYDHSGFFLTSPLPFSGNFVEWKIYLQKIFDEWYLTYFNQADFYLMPILFLTFCLYVFKSGKKLGGFTALFLGATLMAFLGIFYTMSGNFWVHDYYFIAAAYPFIMFFITWGSIGLYFLVKNKGVSIAISILFIMLWAYQFYLIIPICKLNRWDMERHIYAWIVEHKTDLSQIGISKTTLVYVYGDPTPNLGLIAFDRYGIASRPNTLTVPVINPFTLFETLKPYNIHHIIIRKETFSEMQKAFPAEIAQLSLKEGDNYFVLIQK